MNYVSLIGLKIHYHKKEKLMNTLKNQFKCTPNIMELKDGENYGVRLYFNSISEVEQFMNQRTRIMTVDGLKIEFFQKGHKTGYRYYVQYKR